MTDPTQAMKEIEAALEKVMGFIAQLGNRGVEGSSAAYDALKYEVLPKLRTLLAEQQAPSPMRSAESWLEDADKGVPWANIIEEAQTRAYELGKRDASAAVADGMVCVPKYPTDEMFDAFLKNNGTGIDPANGHADWHGDFGNFAYSWGNAIASSKPKERE